MQILNIPLDKRDYCAHYFRAIMICTQQYWPSQYAYCEPERHAWEQCEIKKFVSIDENFEFCLVWFLVKLMMLKNMNENCVYVDEDYVKKKQLDVIQLIKKLLTMRNKQMIRLI